LRRTVGPSTSRDTGRLNIVTDVRSSMIAQVQLYNYRSMSSLADLTVVFTINVKVPEKIKTSKNVENVQETLKTLTKFYKC